ncbi:DUF4222 domain-containing protein [Escherichia fergusonii]|uniref:DUF4222 domain-containing protein n=1 Tax=Escherichia fergusonii TaxID=564 RepID=UPI0015E49F26|nr:DUF4222 domain-containing protein [Escherichia fergusonii]EJC1536206.1 DUF4222 domain-containing protein [Salmonella enterica subsp. enterica serovar Montevideo]MBA8503781.1 DUF4222 domain-containing protein [Escherichia fergusonii]QLM93414.1 DUF4222 domain-containing protein [Escherichia fergusonii]QML50021.1 DUF4222 domain-containing protein [Escherichia fergusonii]QMS07741.1 DUF4222 domain-containing protein [Escherichia fergusonii]
MVNQQYKYNHEARITVISVEENRVVFMSDSYPQPCMRPIFNFFGKSKLIPNTTFAHKTSLTF